MSVGIPLETKMGEKEKEKKRISCTSDWFGIREKEASFESLTLGSIIRLTQANTAWLLRHPRAD